MIDSVRNNMAQIRELCKSHNVESLYLFGSAAKGTFSKSSDIDFLVRFSESIELLDYADNYFDLIEKLQMLLKRDIDLVSEKTLKNPYLIQDINTSKIALYAA